MSLVAAPELSEPLAPGHIRVERAAAGMNFRDVLITLGQIASPGIGFEFAGVVEAVGADVTSIAVGDRVFGLGHRLLWHARSDAADAGCEGPGGNVV